MQNQDNNLHKPFLGIACACFAALLLSTMNLLGKKLGLYLGAIDIAFYRNIVALILLLIGLVAFGKLHLLKTKRPWAQLIRAVIGTTGYIFVVWAMNIMPMSTATALGFTAPLFVTLLSYPLLKEKVSPLRIFVTILGFSGVLLIARPENAIPLYALLVGLTTGFLNGLVAICLRWLGPTENTVTTNFYFLFFGLLMTSFYMPFSGMLPQEGTHLLILLIGLVGLVSLLFKTQGFRFAPAALISPFSYTMIIWAILFDYLFWSSIPSPTIIIGALIIISSNLMLVWRENKKL